MAAIPTPDLAVPYEAPRQVKTMAAVQPMAPKKGCDVLAAVSPPDLSSSTRLVGAVLSSPRRAGWRWVTDRVDGAVRGNMLAMARRGSRCGEAWNDQRRSGAAGSWGLMGYGDGERAGGGRARTKARSRWLPRSRITYQASEKSGALILAVVEVVSKGETREANKRDEGDEIGGVGLMRVGGERSKWMDGVRTQAVDVAAAAIRGEVLLLRPVPRLGPLIGACGRADFAVSVSLPSD